jgi:hypothetical protein
VDDRPKLVEVLELSVGPARAMAKSTEAPALRSGAAIDLQASAW